MMRGMLALLGGLALGLGTSQFPEFSQQYAQRLGGAIDELAIVARDFDADAARAGLDRPQALARDEGSADAFLSGRGISMQALFNRLDRLEAQRHALETAGPLARIADFATLYDPEIGAATLEAYRPAVPATAEGAVHAGAGFVLGYGASYGLIGLAAMPFRRRRDRGGYRGQP